MNRAVEALRELVKASRSGDDEYCFSAEFEALFEEAAEAVDEHDQELLILEALSADEATTYKKARFRGYTVIAALYELNRCQECFAACESTLNSHCTKCTQLPGRRQELSVGPVEVFEVFEVGDNPPIDLMDVAAGWYWRLDGELNGPFDTEALAIADATS